MDHFFQHKARKRFGQNFLVDENIIERIVRAIAPKEDDRLVEIGPGQGAITALLLQRCPSLTAVELDRDLIPLLEFKFRDYPEFSIIEQDALKYDFGNLAGDEQLRIVGNLPYNISTPLLFHLLSFRGKIRDMHFMLQKEVVDRLSAVPGNKSYGRLSVMVQYHCRVQGLFPVPPQSFRPAPKVDSAIVRLVPHATPPHPAQDEDLLERLVNVAFQQRRKTLRNAIKPLYPELDISALPVDAGRRPETLSVKEFVELANYLSTLD
ncbi:16S rRNA (adenine(1518)-N(6)/adenine(1519)-N(6))-dimethyltransferase RsmA [Microbulbifer flavimaris]|uniref:Ribosomal RNA small subunit methyltransferase A n=1 Tax=Microbulbifer flavimaris TaxID=1781068 RepID=A0ABX4HY06_9GAMM|nr:MULTISPECIES: 16S rRNA (adenine(1518)-N(6)/adenine(1519)-N(6))-dimethyltransferase RsmA [Microbulbifer]KUJ82775.1 rRNA methyltransferase [Microbulbifer sp. ZGT114]PCO04951.1 16S rRNA (adenine(1518)-N(6)/adenine(1519)-N(6))-dimethyltransferase RsmA [Microbulbifer flavimaris]